MTTSQKFEFQNLQGQTLAGRLELPAGEPRAHALFAHCFTCSKDIAAAARISRALGARGIAVMRFDFTGLGNSEGDFANTDFSSNIGDLVAAAAHMRETWQAPSLLVGHSLGGAAVLRAAAQIPEVRAVSTIGAPSEPGHVRHLLQEEIDEIEEQGSACVELAGRQFQIRKEFLTDLEQHDLAGGLADLDVAALIFHSPADDTVGIDNATQIYQALRHPKSFVSLDDADHLLSRPRDSEYVAAVLSAWAERYLPQSADEDEVVPEGEVRVETEGGFRTEVQAGRHLVLADEPRRVGGTDLGPTPYGLLLGALGACTTMTLQMYARRKKWPLQKAVVHLRHNRVHAADCEDCESGSGQIDRIEREVGIEGPLSDEQRQRLLEIADRCPVHKTLMNEKQILTRLRD